MSKTTAFILIVIAFVIGVGVGAFGLLWATGGTGAPSRDVGEMAPTLEMNDADNNDNDASNTANNPGEPVRYRIVSGESEARFYIDEVLLGNETTVVGVTQDVAGDLIVDFSNPSQSEVGTIAVNARTLATDNDFRNQAIRGQILQSAQDQYEFVMFEPSTLENLPTEPVEAGTTIEFQITGDLTVRGVTNPVTFDASVTRAEDGSLRGTATTTILYSDFGISIQAPPTVSNIGDEVTLEIEFVAQPTDDE